MKSLAYISWAMVAVVLSASAALAQEASPAPSPVPTLQKVTQTKKAAQKVVQKQKTGVVAQQTVHVPGVALLITVPLSADQKERMKEDYAVITRGDEALKAGDTDDAIADFLEARQSESQSLLALVRLAKAYTAAGRTEEAIDAYRQLIYPVPGQDWSHANQLSPTMQMNFSLLLLNDGQEVEALAAYRRALKTLNYDGLGKPMLEIPLPDIGPGGLPYSPKLLRAMDCVGIGIDPSGFDGPKLKEAVKLAPDLAVASFYLGRYLCSCNDSSARGPIERAIQLGDAATAKAAKKYLQLCR